MYCLSLDYKRADGSLRSRFTLTKSGILALADKIDGGLVALFTCNRSELYFECRPQEILRHLPVGEEVLSKSVFYKEDAAVLHLLRVVCGLESMLLGEDDIARQVKKAYLFSLEQHISSGRLNLIFQNAFKCAKKVKSGTKLSKSATSYATLSAKCAKAFIEEKQLAGKILLVGVTGDLGSVIAKNIVSYGFDLTVTLRSGRNVGTDYKTIAYKDRYAALGAFDVIITASASPHVIFDWACCKNSIRPNQLFIDMSVPFDVDRKICAVSSLVDVDYFKTLSSQNNAAKQNALKEAEVIIHAQLLEIKSILAKHSEGCKLAILSNAM